MNMIMSDGVAWGSLKRTREPVERAGKISFTSPAIRVPDYDVTKMTTATNVNVPKADPRLKNKIIDTIPVKFTTLRGIDSFIDRKVLEAPQGLPEHNLIAWVQEKIKDRYSSVASDAFSDRGLLTSATAPLGIASRSEAKDAISKFRIGEGKSSMSVINPAHAGLIAIETKLADFIDDNYIILNSGVLSRERAINNKLRDLVDEAAIKDRDILTRGVVAAEKAADEAADAKRVNDMQKQIERGTKADEAQRSANLKPTFASPVSELLEILEKYILEAKTLKVNEPAHMNDQVYLDETIAIGLKAYNNIKNTGQSTLSTEYVQKVWETFIEEDAAARERNRLRTKALRRWVKAKRTTEKAKEATSVKEGKVKAKEKEIKEPYKLTTPDKLRPPSVTTPTTPTTPKRNLPTSRLNLNVSPSLSAIPEQDDKQTERAVKIQAFLKDLDTLKPFKVFRDTQEMTWNRKLDINDAENLQQLLASHFPPKTTLIAPNNRSFRVLQQVKADTPGSTKAQVQLATLFTAQSNMFKNWFDPAFAPFSLKAWIDELP